MNPVHTPRNQGQRIATHRVALALTACLGLLAPLSTTHAQPVDEEWPCIQVFVPELSIGILWPNPIDPSAVASWRDDRDMASLARELAEAENYSDAAQERVAGFAQGIPEATRTDELNRLAAGIVELANERRMDYISGIRRYTRQQIAIAQQVEDGLNMLADHDLAAEQGAAAEQGVNLDDPTQRAAFEETLQWHQRVYDQRERAIISLCERPVELEQTLSSILRDVASYLP